jgi:hypothetical protein
MASGSSTTAGNAGGREDLILTILMLALLASPVCAVGLAAWVLVCSLGT